MAPLARAFARAGDCEQMIVHVGKEREDASVCPLLRDLDVPRPDLYLGVGASTHAVETARTMVALEPVMQRFAPDWLLLVGDINAVTAAALVSSKLNVPMAHVEAGLRCHDRADPHEINRLVADRLGDVLLATEEAGMRNLAAEGVAETRSHFVGSLTIDLLDRHRLKAERLAVHEAMGLAPGRFVVVVLGRSYNVEEPGRLGGILKALFQIAADSACSVIMPLDSAASGTIRRSHLGDRLAPIHCIEPLPYLDLIGLLGSAGVVITDSGQIQEITTVMGIPCVTLARATEREATIAEGTNRLFHEDLDGLTDLVRFALLARREPVRPALWDGHAADRIVRHLVARGSQLRPAPPHPSLQPAAGGPAARSGL